MTDAASDGYEVALLDWLGCAARGRQEEAAEAARGVEDRLVFAATSGHVLDFDDTYLPGLAHLTAPVAPAALVLAAELEKSTGDALAAFVRGFEAMGALARASHPALYDRGWHPTAVCGAAGAAVAASHLIDAPVDAALAIALLQSGGLRAAFGSHGKSLQVGLAAASGLQAARLARAGARVPLDTVARGWQKATGGTFARPQEGQDRAIDENWIKAWPCCLQTHGAIEAAASVRGDHHAADKLTVTVHPVSVQAAAEGPEPADGLQAKFSIPYLTAFTLLHGPPDVESFAQVDPDAVQRAHSIEIKTNSDLLESECVLTTTAAEGQAEIAIVKAALGSPGHPMDAQAIRAKLQGLLGTEPPPTLDQDEPAERLLQRFGL
ncbi:MAG: MmgE/PrpD family protein [Thermoleophilaceae bacterium]